jgi:hypothetical protein
MLTKKMRLRTILLGLTISLTSCQNQQRSISEINEGIVKSINDTIYYYSNPISKELDFAMSPKSIKPGYFITKITNDTIELNETFKGSIWLLQQNATIIVTSPKDTIYSTSTHGAIDNLVITFTPTKKAIYKFTGFVKFDTVEYPFDYKFIVVDKETRKSIYSYIGEIQKE